MDLFEHENCQCAGGRYVKEALPEGLALAFIEKELGKEGPDIIVKKEKMINMQKDKKQ